ncbi:conserved hypothetical protein [Burkholderia cepacia]
MRQATLRCGNWTDFLDNPSSRDRLTGASRVPTLQDSFIEKRSPPWQFIRSQTRSS